MNLKHYQQLKENLGDQVSLCVVTKGRDSSEILSFYELGERIFGENRVEECIEKATTLPNDIEWHFIGHLQRNKIQKILPHISVLESLDNYLLAEALEKELEKRNETLKVYVEFHLALSDIHKSGFLKDEANDCFKKLMSLPHLEVIGIMVMGPNTDDEEEIRSVFLEANELFLRIQKKYPTVTTLSMGMSHDYPIAIECGANHVRIGTYLFEEEI